VKQPLVTVVTPVYNGEKYLPECIQSVLAQTYANWEYVIVDNCSTDHTLEIARSYAEKDPRIRIRTNQEHVGLIQNHNIAFRQISANSKYCKGVEADDWLFPECIQEMVNVAEAHPSVGIVGAYALKGAEVICDGLSYPSTVIPGRQLCRGILLGLRFPLGTPTTILIRSDLIRRRACLYHEPHLYADKEACFDLLRDTDFGFVHQVLTCVRIHPDSATSSDAERLNTYILGNLSILTKHGSYYLGAEEKEKLVKDSLKQYFTFLGQSLLRREKEFWDYHENGIRELGYSVSRTKLLRAFFLEVGNVLLNPKRIARKGMRILVNASIRG
jgi:glycosyltransferase involved in cell wall biosynthesis